MAWRAAGACVCGRRHDRPRRGHRRPARDRGAFLLRAQYRPGTHSQCSAGWSATRASTPSISR
jgi:hypothetical protein